MGLTHQHVLSYNPNFSLYQKSCKKIQQFLEIRIFLQLLYIFSQPQFFITHALEFIPDIKVIAIPQCSRYTIDDIAAPRPYISVLMSDCPNPYCSGAALFKIFSSKFHVLYKFHCAKVFAIFIPYRHIFH